MENNQQEIVNPITRIEDMPEYIQFVERRDSVLHDENPYFIRHDSPLLDVSYVDGREVMNFGSYNYVGMSGRREVEDAAIEAIRKYGTSASGSRLLAGEKSLHEELEKELAAWKHAEDAVVLVGGHSTNVTFVGNFAHPGDLIMYDQLIHNSVMEGCRLSGATARPFPHNDPEALRAILQRRRHKFNKVLIVIEGVYSMDGDISPVPEFVAVKKEFGAFLMVDEAHSACVIGETGGGVDEYYHLAPDDIDIKMGTLSKGLGACGGYIAGSHKLVEYLRYNLPGFVFSVGMSPPLAAAALCSIRLLKTDKTIIRDLQRNIACFMNACKKYRLDTGLAGKTAIIPVLVGKDEETTRLSSKLFHEGVFVPPALYPAVPKDQGRLRFCVTSAHKPEQIEKAIDILISCAAKNGIELPRV